MRLAAGLVSLLLSSLAFGQVVEPGSKSWTFQNCGDAGWRVVCPSVGARGFDYPGVPYLTESLPGAIAPTEPTPGNVIAGWPYDPLPPVLPTPEWSDASNQYYVDAGSSCNDSNNGGRGSPASPRCSIPGLSTSGNGTWTLNAGDQIFIVGEGATYGGDNDVQSVNMPGTQGAPIWVIGVGTDKPELRFERFFVGTGGMTHALWDNVHFRSPTDDFRMQFSGGVSQYIAFRSISCSGSEGNQSGNSRRCFSFGGGGASSINQYVVVYDSDIWGLGRWQDDWNTSKDMHGIQMNPWTRNIWVINSRIRNLQGDSIQCGNSNWWDFTYEYRPHNIFIAGNEFYENYENGYDQKGCYNVVFAWNHVHDFTNSIKAANGTAIIVEQDSEGHVGGRNSWHMFNLVEDSGNAFALKATTDDAKPALIGNVTRNISGPAVAFTQRCYSGQGTTTCADGADIVWNTFDCNGVGTGITNVQSPGSSGQTVNMDGNLFFDCTDGGEGSDVNWENYGGSSITLNYRWNLNYRTGGTVSLASQTSRFNIYNPADNLLNVNPLLTNPDGGDYTLQAGSPAIDFTSSLPEAVQAFLDKYPLSMTDGFPIDRALNARPAGSGYDIGAFERP